MKGAILSLLGWGRGGFQVCSKISLLFFRSLTRFSCPHASILPSGRQDSEGLAFQASFARPYSPQEPGAGDGAPPRPPALTSAHGGRGRPLPRGRAPHHLRPNQGRPLVAAEAAAGLARGSPCGVGTGHAASLGSPQGRALGGWKQPEQRREHLGDLGTLSSRPHPPKVTGRATNLAG